MPAWSPGPAGTSEVRWLSGRTADRPFDENPWVQDLVGGGWEAYVRIFCEPTNAPSWQAVADRYGKSMHPLVEWEKIATGRDRDEGMLPVDGWRALCGALARATTTPDSTYCLLWDVRSAVDHRELRDLPRVEFQRMTCWLARAPLPGVAELRGWDQPDYLWPADHAWTVMAHYDFEYAVVGGSRSLIDTIVGLSALEALEVPTTSRWGDTIN